MITDDSVIKDCNVIISTLIMKKNYLKQSWLPIAVLVEGAIDKTFYDMYKQDNVQFISITELSKLRYLNKPANNKGLILNVLRTIQNSNCNVGELKSDLFGIVDKDSDENNSNIFTISNLFVTDAHDLETSLLSSDDGLLCRMGIDLTEDEFEDAILLSYEFGLIRQHLHGSESFKIKNLLEDDASIDFSHFVTGKELDVRKVYDYLNEIKAYPLNHSIIEEQIESFINDHSRMLSSTGVFILKNAVLKKLLLCGIWDKINGHDLCSAIRFFCPDAAKNYPASMDDNKRYMETVIVKTYEFSNFKRLELGKKMRNAALLKG